MAPSWIPMCTAMQVYCEPYFAAVERWRTYADPEVLRNRIALIECANKLFNEYSQAPGTFEFELQCETDAELEAEVLPTAGKSYVHGGDTAAFQAAKKLVAEKVFNRVGVFFQQNLLKVMAGNSESYLQASNTHCRQSIIAAIEKLFRISEAAGIANFAYRELFAEDNTFGQLKVYPTPQLSVVAKSFVDYLIEESKNVKAKVVDFSPHYFETGSPRSSPSKSKKSKSPSSKHGNGKGSSSKKVSHQQSIISILEEEEPDWNENHSSIGTKVAAYFPIPTYGSSAKVVEKRLFYGTVVSYAKPSKRGAGDQLYHIRFEDGDEEDYFQHEYDAGVKLYKKEYGANGGADASAGAMDDFADDDDQEEEEEVPKSKVTPAKKASSSGTSTTPSKGGSNGKSNSASKKGKSNGSASKSPNEIVYSRTGRPSRAAARLSESLQVPAVSRSSRAPVTKGKIPTKKDASELVEDEEFAARVGRSLKDEDDNDNLTFESNEPPQPVAVEEWTFDHMKIGVPIAAYFPEGKKRVLFTGKVIKYCPSSGEDENDQLYRVQFEDGDEEDYDEDQLTAAESLYAQKCVADVYSVKGLKTDKFEDTDVEEEAQDDEEEEEEVAWTADHESVGTSVAAYFPPTGKQKKLYHGEVTKYAPPSADDKADQLYHVIWSDGDECDLEEDGYQQALQLYEADQKRKSTSSSSTHRLFGNDSSAQKRPLEDAEVGSPEKKKAAYNRKGHYAPVGLPTMMVIDKDDDEIHSVSGQPTPQFKNAFDDDDEEESGNTEMKLDASGESIELVDIAPDLAAVAESSSHQDTVAAKEEDDNVARNDAIGEMDVADDEVQQAAASEDEEQPAASDNEDEEQQMVAKGDEDEENKDEENKEEENKDEKNKEEDPNAMTDLLGHHTGDDQDDAEGQAE